MDFLCSMQNNWQTKKLDDACSVVYGTRVVNKRDGGGTFPVYGGGGATFFMDKYNREDCMVVARFAMSEKCTRFVSGKFFLNDSGLTVLPKNSKEILQKFLDYQLISLNDHIYSLARGSAQKNLDMSAFRKIEISYPEFLTEQQRIVKILDEVFEKIEIAKLNTEKNLKNSKELFESHLQRVFTNSRKDWQEKSLEELGQITSSKRIYKSEYVKKGVPFYRIKEIKELANNDEISLELYISKDRYNEIKETFGVPAEGDVLMTAVGTIGEIYVVPNKDEFYFKDGNVLWFKGFKSVNPYFLKYALVSFVEQIKRLSKGSAYSALTIEKIEKYKIFIPKSLSEQKNIVNELNMLSQETKRLETIYSKKLEDLEELKKSILKQAFEGRL